MNNMERLIYESRISNLEDALNLALCYLSNFEPPDSRAVSDEFVAMAAIHMDSGEDREDKCMPIIEKALEGIRQQALRDEWVNRNTTNTYVIFSDIPNETL